MTLEQAVTGWATLTQSEARAGSLARLTQSNKRRQSIGNVKPMDAGGVGRKDGMGPRVCLVGKLASLRYMRRKGRGPVPLIRWEGVLTMPGVSPTGFRQCDSLIAKRDFTFKPGGKGRSISVKRGDSFWVTSCITSAATRRGNVCIARKRESMHYRFEFEAQQVRELFDHTGKDYSP